ncbi:hypothetical protein Tco_1518348, partial [Tanacetum coccineum]
DDLSLCLSSSPGPSTPSSFSSGPLTRPSYSPRPSKSEMTLGKGECLNSKFLGEKIKILDAQINILEATLEMKRHPENHVNTNNV